jgi:hemoglobin
MNDITTRDDVEYLVKEFYDRVIKDDLIGFFFTDIAKIELNHHLPKMYNFWESILLGNPVYEGQPMAKHFPINDIVAMEEKHFNRWLQVWEKRFMTILKVKMLKTPLQEHSILPELCISK